MSEDAVIAEWCEPKPSYTHTFDECVNPPKSPRGFWHCVCIYDHGDIPEWVPIPFSTDLNAMALAEHRAWGVGRERAYAEVLVDIVFCRDGNNPGFIPKDITMSGCFALATATVGQRAEALVKVIGK